MRNQIRADPGARPATRGTRGGASSHGLQCPALALASVHPPPLPATPHTQTHTQTHTQCSALHQPPGAHWVLGQSSTLLSLSCRWLHSTRARRTDLRRRERFVLLSNCTTPAGWQPHAVEGFRRKGMLGRISGEGRVSCTCHQWCGLRSRGDVRRTASGVDSKAILFLLPRSTELDVQASATVAGRLPPLVVGVVRLLSVSWLASAVWSTSGKRVVCVEGCCEVACGLLAGLFSSVWWRMCDAEDRVTMSV